MTEFLNLKVKLSGRNAILFLRYAYFVPWPRDYSSFCAFVSIELCFFEGQVWSSIGEDASEKKTKMQPLP